MRLMPENSPFPRLLALPLLAVVIFTYFLVTLMPEQVYRTAHCPLRDITGIPCFTCGGTHATVAIANGMIVEALVANPLVTASFFIFSLWCVWALTATVYKPFRHLIQLSGREKKALIFVMATALVLTWIWEIVQLT